MKKQANNYNYDIIPLSKGIIIEINSFIQRKPRNIGWKTPDNGIYNAGNKVLIIPITPFASSVCKNKTVYMVNTYVFYIIEERKIYLFQHEADFSSDNFGKLKTPLRLNKYKNCIKNGILFYEEKMKN